MATVPSMIVWGGVHKIDGSWDIVIAHPPCTYLTNSANAWYEVERYGDKARQRYKDRYKAIVFFMQMIMSAAPCVAVENPIGIMSNAYRKPDQIIHPYQFGHPVSKATCLWLKNLPPLMPTQLVIPEMKPGGFSGPGWYVKDENGKILSWNNPRTAKERSKTFPGIANAMAEQWG